MLYALHHGRTYPRTKSHRRPDRNRPANRSGKGWLLSGTLQATLSPPPHRTFRQRNQKDGSHGFLQWHRTAIPQGCSRPCVATLHTIATWNDCHHADGIVSGRSPLRCANFVRTCSASIGVCLSGIGWRLDFSGVEWYVRPTSRICEAGDSHLRTGENSNCNDYWRPQKNRPCHCRASRATARKKGDDRTGTGCFER